MSALTVIYLNFYIFIRDFTANQSLNFYSCYFWLGNSGNVFTWAFQTQAKFEFGNFVVCIGSQGQFGRNNFLSFVYFAVYMQFYFRIDHYIFCLCISTGPLCCCNWSHIFFICFSD